MRDDQIQELTRTYRAGLLEDTLPFWTRHGIDWQFGGYLTALNRDGSVVDTDKGMWQQGRFAWLLSHLYNTVEPRDEWLELARLGIRFLREHGFDKDGRMWFVVTREGQPLRKRRYAYTECFAIMALAEFARAAQEQEAADEALALYERYRGWMSTEGSLAAKWTATRPLKSLGVPMIEMGVCQVLRDALDYDRATEAIDCCIAEIARDFVKPERQAVMETVGPQGEIRNHFDGRTLNPGHAIEAAWFILREGKLRQRADYVRLGCQMLDWMWQRGWDTEYGGIFYFRDLDNLPVQEYWHDMKFWWPHNETIIATLLAWSLTGEAKYADWHRQVHNWSYGHFPDPQHGEWFGYLHRDGRLSVPLKGNLWKGPFHLPRMQLICWRLLESLAGEIDPR